MRGLMRRLWKDESGLTVLEYGIAAAAIALIAGVVYKLLGKRIKELFTSAGSGGEVKASDLD